jgi:hypothetical protein
LAYGSALKKQIAEREAAVFLASAVYYPIFPLNFEPMLAGVTKKFRMDLLTVIHCALGVQRNRRESLSSFLSM